MKRIIAVMLLLLMLVGCHVGTGDEEPTAADRDTEMFTDRDRRADYDAEQAIAIDLNQATSPLKIEQEGTYLLSGSLDGMIMVDAPDTAKLQIVLADVTVNNATGAALYVKQADKVFVTLADGTKNTLSNGGAFEAIDENHIDAAIFSKQDITLNGTGNLTVTSPIGHGIVSKDDLVITGGVYTIQSASHGLDANDSVRLTEATIEVDAGKDGIHAENDEDAALGFVYIESGMLSIEAQGDGISAGSDLTVKDGQITVLAGGGYENGTKDSSDFYGGFMGGGMMGGPGGGGPRPTAAVTSTTDESSTSMKGLKSGTVMKLDGGMFAIDSADDGLHANTSLTIADGTYTIASGDDGIHAEDTLTVIGGEIAITESYEGLEALHIRMTGGTVTMNADDDGLNAAGGADASGMNGRRDGRFGGGMMGGASNGSIIISGGNLSIQASGDGIDANGYLEITGGYTVVCGPTRGDTATLDYDTSATISGGTFIGTGAMGMAQTFSQSKQGVIALQVGQQAAGTAVCVTDADGKEILVFTPELDFAVVILSDPQIVSGRNYTVTVGTQSGTFAAN